MKAHLTRRYWFSASHRLHNPELAEGDNRRIYGKCNNPYGHGHNYALEVTVGGSVDPRTGMVCNLVDLDGVVDREILERYGHTNLNTLPEFNGEVPTSENLCAHIFDILKRQVTFATLEKVKLDETALNSFEYAAGEVLRT